MSDAFHTLSDFDLGNGAQGQFQLDNYGHVLQSLFFFRHTGGKIDAEKRKMLQRLTAEAIRFWKRVDNGIWEERETHDFTYGKVMCWLAFTSGFLPEETPAQRGMRSRPSSAVDAGANDRKSQPAGRP